jgi:hypothetical protein
MKNFIKSFKSFDIRKRVNAGKITFITGLVCAVIGFICIFFTEHFGFQMLASSLFAAAVGVVVFMFSYDKAQNLGIDLSEPDVQPGSSLEPNNFDAIDFGDDDNSDEILFDEKEVELDDEDDFDLSDFEPVQSFEPEVSPENKPTANPDELLETVNIDHGMVTRQYLYETITQVLPNCDTTYDKETVYDDDSREFNSWDAIIKQAADVFRSNQEDSPNLIELRDKLFYWQLTVSRVKWIKNVEQLVDELVNIVKYDDNGGCDDSVYGTGVYVGQKAIIKIYKGSTAMVSVKDAYRQVKDFVLDTDNKMPVVVGIDSEGKVVSEQTFYYGCLEKRNEELGVTYPSPHWIPAPFVMDVIPWFDRKGIRIEPCFNDGIYTFNIKYGCNDKQYFDIKSYSIENCYLQATNEILKMMESN